MMKSIFYRLTVGLIVCSSMSSCLFQEPELTDDGELGIDPTEATISADIALNLTLPAADVNQSPFTQPTTEGTEYRRRTIVAAIAEGMPTVSKSIVTELPADESQMLFSVSLKLHARKYQIVVWSDYVTTDDTGYFYNTDQLPNIFMSQTYRGCNDFKDAAYASDIIDLTAHRNEWNYRVNLELDLIRPVARLQMKANDAAKFLDKYSDAIFNVRISYPGYICMGYNIVEQKPRHSLMYMKFEKTFKRSELSSAGDYMLAFDYLLCNAVGTTQIPIKVEVMNSAKSEVYATTAFNAICKAGTVNTVVYNFLTAQGGDGVDFDADFSGTGTVVVPALPTN